MSEETTQSKSLDAEKIEREIRRVHCWIGSLSLQENILNALWCMHMNGKFTRNLGNATADYWQHQAITVADRQQKLLAHLFKVKARRDRLHSENQRLKAEIKKLTGDDNHA